MLECLVHRYSIFRSNVCLCLRNGVHIEKDVFCFMALAGFLFPYRRTLAHMHEERERERGTKHRFLCTHPLFNIQSRVSVVLNIILSLFSTI